MKPSESCAIDRNSAGSLLLRLQQLAEAWHENELQERLPRLGEGLTIAVGELSIRDPGQ